MRPGCVSGHIRLLPCSLDANPGLCATAFPEPGSTAKRAACLQQGGQVRARATPLCWAQWGKSMEGKSHA